MTISNNRMLIIAPHADDEILGVGGTISKYRATHEIGVIVCGLRKHDLSHHIKAAVRSYDFKKILWDYKDEHYHESFKSQLECIETAYMEFKPNIVYIPNATDFNNDHQVIHRQCEIVCRRYQSHAPDTVLMYETPSSTTQSFNKFECNYYIPLEKHNITDKVEMLTQYYPHEVRKYPNPRSPKGIETYARFRGMECNSKYAEGFNLIYQKNG